MSTHYEIAADLYCNESADDDTKELVASGQYADGAPWIGEWFREEVRDLLDEKFNTADDARIAIDKLEAAYLGADAEGVEVYLRVI